MVQSSPMLFLDEFQLPDRAASKIMSNLMTSFFQLGGVLIATSNRMTEDLVKAMGMGFPRPPLRLESLGWRFVMRGVGNLYAQHGEFAAFLEVLKVRCETWEMGGSKDYRRIDIQGDERTQADSTGNQASFLSDLEGLSMTASEPCDNRQQRVAQMYQKIPSSHTNSLNTTLLKLPRHLPWNSIAACHGLPAVYRSTVAQS